MTSATNERTFIATVVPFAGIANSLIVVLPSAASTRQVAALYANLNALVFDFVTRTKVGGLHLNYFLVKQLPVIRPEHTRSMTWIFLCLVCSNSATTQATWSVGTRSWL